MADSLQALIRKIPDCVSGPGIADFAGSVARQVRDQAPGLDSAGSWFDFGEGTKVYSTDRIVSAANELELFGEGLRQKEGPFCRASDERNRLIILLGNVDGLVRGRIGVNATISAAQSQLKQDLADNVKTAFSLGKWVFVGVVVIMIAIAVGKVA